MQIAKIKVEYEGNIGVFEDVSELESRLNILYANKPEYFDIIPLEEFITNFNTGDYMPGVDMIIAVKEKE